MKFETAFVQTATDNNMNIRPIRKLNMNFDRVAVDCKKVQKKDGKDLARFCGMQNWNI